MKLAVVALASLLLAGTNPLPALSSRSTDSPVGAATSSTAFWTAHGISSSTQNSLLKKISEGATLDSWNPSSRPVSSTQHVTDLAIETWETFADGSLAVASVERPATIITHVGNSAVTRQTAAARPQDSPRTGINNCKQQNYSGVAIYTNCRVIYQNGAYVTFSFVAGFSLVRGGPDTISGKGSSGGQACVTSCSEPKNFKYKAAESSSGPAYDTWSVEYSFAGVTSSTLTLTLEVGSDSYRSHT